MYEYEDVSPEDIQAGDWVSVVYGENNSSVGLTSRALRDGLKTPWPEDFFVVYREANILKLAEERNLERTYDYGADLRVYGPNGYTWVRRKTYKSYDPEQIGDRDDDL